MLSLPPSVRIFVATEPADMRKSFDGLGQLVREVFDADPLSGHLFVFANRRGDRVKLLYWDRDGYALWYKRLEEGRFTFPQRLGRQVGEHGLELAAAELAMVLDGVDVDSVQRRKRYRRPAASAS